MYPQDLKDLFINPDIKRPSSKCKDGTHLGILLRKETGFLNNEPKLAVRLWYIQNDVHEQVKCPHCSNPTNIKINKDGARIQFCSLTCRSASKDKSGLTLAQRNGLKQSKTKTTIDGDTKTSIAQRAALKSAETMKKRGSDGLTIYEKSAKKQSKTRTEKHFPAWNKGIQQTQEAKEHLSKVRIALYETGKLVHWNTGNETSTETKRKISQKLLNQELTMSEESKVLRAKTMQKLYDNGWIHPSHRPELIKAKQDTAFKKYNRKHKNQTRISDDSYNKLNDKDWLYNEHVIQEKSLLLISKELNVSDGTVGRYLHNFGIETQNFQQSMAEKDLFNFVKSIISCEVIPNTRSIIPPKELDIYIPSKKIGIEYCGLFWHNSLILGNTYHADKLRMCVNNDVELITIFEDEWINKREMVEAKLKSLLGVDDRPSIYARKCSIDTVDKVVKKDFYDNNHIQGSTNTSIDVGLYYENNVVACMSFTKRDNSSFELVRYATSCKVVGGFSKLLKNFLKTCNPTELISFADLRWSTGNLYNKTGWKLDKIIPPDYSYIFGQTRSHKFNFRHTTGLKHLPNYDSTLSESENMLNHDIHKIYDCGKMRFVYLSLS